MKAEALSTGKLLLIFKQLIMKNLYTTLLLSLFSLSISAQCNHPDFDALLAIYNSLDGPNWVFNGGWVEGAAGTDCEPCDWDYVNCNTQNRVKSVSFSNIGLKGFIPSEVGDLEFLESISFNFSDLSGSTIPDEIYNLTNLKRLSIRDSDVEGTISPLIGNLTQLEELDFAQNELEGSIPSEIGNLTKLKEFFANQNDLTGTIPASLKNCSQMEWVELTFNKLTGVAIDDLGGLENAVEFDIGYNEIVGSLPEAFGNFIDLRYLGLNSNNFSGCIPNSYVKLCGQPVNFSENSELSNENFENFCDTYEGSCMPVGTFNYAPLAIELVNTIAIDQLLLNGALENVSFNIIDINGRILQRGVIQGNGIPLDFDSKGMFFINMTTENQMCTKKFMKK